MIKVNILTPLESEMLSWVGVLDGGLATLEARGEVRLSDEELSDLGNEELGRLRTFELYENQYYQVEYDMLSRENVLRWKYVTPCITTLEKVEP